MLYRDGVAPREIAKTLNREGVPGPAGKTWGPSTINGNAQRGTGLLNNELYLGRPVWNRLRYVKDPTSGKRRSKLNSKDQWVIKDVPHLRIIPQEPCLRQANKAQTVGLGHCKSRWLRGQDLNL